MPCIQYGKAVRGNCAHYEDHGYNACARQEDRGYNACNNWDKQCNKWGIFKFLCKAFTWFCRAWVWVSNIICVGWTWIKNMVCVAWSWLAQGVCLAWHFVVGAIAGVIQKALFAIVAVVRWIRGIKDPECDPVNMFNHLGKSKAEVLNWFDEAVGFFTTPIKIILGIQGWDPTGCSASGSGSIVRSVSWSTDGLYTIDIKIQEMTIGLLSLKDWWQQQSPSHGERIPEAFIRLEVKPFKQAWSYCNTHELNANDIITFAGPMWWDHNKKWLEVHPHTLQHDTHVVRLEQSRLSTPLQPALRLMTPNAATVATIGTAAIITTSIGVLIFLNRKGWLPRF